MTKDEVIKYLSELAKVREMITSFRQELNELEDLAFFDSPDLNSGRHEVLASLKGIEEEVQGLLKGLMKLFLKRWNQ